MNSVCFFICNSVEDIVSNYLSTVIVAPGRHCAVHGQIDKRYWSICEYFTNNFSHCMFLIPQYKFDVPIQMCVKI